MFLQSIARRPQRLRRLACVVVFSAAAWLPVAASGAGGDLLWQDQFDTGASDVAAAVAVGGGRVFAVGTGALDFLVRAYDAATGTLLWQDRFDTGGADRGRAIATEAGRVFAAGLAAGDGFLVRAYDAGTGAVLWTDRFDSTGFDEALAIAADAGRVFAAGRGGDNQDFLVRAYDAATGTLLWQDQFDGGGLDDALAVAAQGGRVFAAGFGGTQFLVRAYDAATGTPLWQDTVNLSVSGAQAIAVDSSRVIVVAENFTVRAYDAATGGLLWQDKFADGVSAKAVAAEQGRVFVAGRGVGMGGGAFLAVAYDAATGTLLWQNRFDKRKSLDMANAIVALNGKVSVAGARYKGAIRSKEWVVRTYDGVTGALLWQDRFDVRKSEDEARAIAADTGRVFAVGTSADDFLVRAYAVE